MKKKYIATFVIIVMLATVFSGCINIRIPISETPTPTVTETPEPTTAPTVAPTTAQPTTLPESTTPPTTPKITAPPTTEPTFESSSKYFPTEPGYYGLYKVIDSGPPVCNGEIEMVFQYPSVGTFYATLTSTKGTSTFDDVIAGEKRGGLLRFNHGCPCGNQANYFMDYLILPPSFSDENDWNVGITKYHSEKVDSITVGSNTFNDCIKITITNSGGKDVIGGEMYLARDIGIIKWTLDRRNDSPFKMEILKWGKLSQRTVSGTLTLDGKTSAEGYRVQLSNCDNEGESACTVDENGKFEIKFYGNTIILRYGPLGEYGSLDYKESKTEKIGSSVKKIDLRMY